MGPVSALELMIVTTVGVLAFVVLVLTGFLLVVWSLNRFERVRVSARSDGTIEPETEVR
jgi:uncharacterized membrane protein